MFRLTLALAVLTAHVALAQHPSPPPDAGTPAPADAGTPLAPDAGAHAGHGTASSTSGEHAGHAMPQEGSGEHAGHGAAVSPPDAHTGHAMPQHGAQGAHEHGAAPSAQEPSTAQHEHGAAPSAQAPGSMQHEHGAAAQGGHAGHGGMGPLGYPSSREASGTAWQPDDTPHAGLHFEAGGFRFMFHELLFAGWDWQGGPRGGSQPTLLGWGMLMAEHDVGTGRLGARVMLSPEPLTVGRDGGYPLLLQSGETFEGEPLHDRQHPHDLFMELALTYAQPLGAGYGLTLYVAPAGEPALGPVAYPHRASAAFDPAAALGHHWQDSSHISFGVVTAGVTTPSARLELSVFNGREPDENRWNLDLRKLDAYAVRLSTNPDRHVSAQVSYGYLPSAEPSAPDEPLHRLTASVHHHRLLGDRLWASSLVFGRDVASDHPATNALLLESTLDLDGKNVVFGRAEWVQKTAHDLVLDEGAVGEGPFDVGALALGYVRNLGTLGPFVPGVGVRAAVNYVPAALEGAYGSRFPVGGIVFLRLASASTSAAH